MNEEIKKKIRKHKKEVLDSQNANKIWLTIKKLQGNNAGFDKQKILQTEEGNKVTDRSKANAFKAAYRRVSTLKIKKDITASTAEAE